MKGPWQQPASTRPLFPELDLEGLLERRPELAEELRRAFEEGYAQPTPFQSTSKLGTCARCCSCGRAICFHCRWGCSHLAGDRAGYPRSSPRTASTFRA